jgi:hypothetical protein
MVKLKMIQQMSWMAMMTHKIETYRVLRLPKDKEEDRKMKTEMVGVV